MALSIKNDEADRLARELAAITGESITEAIVTSLRERVERLRSAPPISVRLGRLVKELAQYAVLDNRSADEILGYDESGLSQ